VRKKQYSLRVILLLACGLMLVTITTLVIFGIRAATHAIRNQTYEIANGVISNQAQRLQNSLDTIEASLSGFSNDSGDIVVLESGRRDTSGWFSAVYRLRLSLNNSVATQIADNYFLYIPGVTFFSVGGTLSQQQQQAIQDAISSSGFRTRRWLSVGAEDVNYLLCVQQVSRSYVGAWVSVDAVLADIAGRMDQTLYFDIAMNGSFLGSKTGSPYTGSYPSLMEEGYQVVSDGNQRYLLAAHSIEKGNFLVALVPDDSLGTATADYMQIMVPLSLCVFVVFALMLGSLWRGIMEPTAELTKAIRRLRDGDAEARVDSAAACAEFSEMNAAFNEMVQEIRELKIGVYEEQLRRQNIQIEYLKMQVTPHFLINCLNTVYQLTEAGQPKLTLQMVKGLSRHLRYMLNAGMTVPLSQELEMVENYVELSSIRYPNGLTLRMEQDPQAMEATAIPLLVLNFVENTVKYEAAPDRLLEIHVQTRLEQAEAEDRLHVTIWDTGRGFSPDKLQQLQDVPAFVQASQNRHIGISNVLQRARLIMGECVFHFSNRDGAGAQIDMDLPYLPYREKGELNDAFNC